MKVPARLLPAVIAALVVVLLLGFIELFPFVASARYQRVLIDLGHVPLFTIIALATHSGLSTVGRLTPRDPATYLAAGTACALLAVGSEALQAFDPARSASAADLFRNFAGITLGLGVRRLWDGEAAPLSGRARKRLIALLAAAAGLALVPTAWTAAAYAHRSFHWPEIVGKGYRLERAFTAAYQSEIEIVRQEGSAQGNGAGEAFLVRLGTCIECGILLQELAGNWDGLSKMCLAASNPGTKALALAVRLGDGPMFFRSTSSYSSTLFLPPGQHVTRCLPFNDFSPSIHRSGLGSAAILARGTPAADEILIHRIWLE